jgi:hypothetical protein
VNDDWPREYHRMCSAIQYDGYEDAQQTQECTIWAVEALDEMKAENEQLRARVMEADRLLRNAYADAHSEDVPAEVLRWLNPEDYA